jgi:hypothetical protein
MSHFPSNIAMQGTVRSVGKEDSGPSDHFGWLSIKNMWQQPCCDVNLDGTPSRSVTGQTVTLTAQIPGNVKTTQSVNSSFIDVNSARTGFCTFPGVRFSDINHDTKWEIFLTNPWPSFLTLQGHSVFPNLSEFSIPFTLGDSTATVEHPYLALHFSSTLWFNSLIAIQGS